MNMTHENGDPPHCVRISNCPSLPKTECYLGYESFWVKTGKVTCDLELLITLTISASTRFLGSTEEEHI